MPMMANSNMKGAAKKFKKAITSLARAASPDAAIITTCPSCNFMLKTEGLRFFDSKEARFVSKHIYDASEYLLEIHRQGRLNTNFGYMPLKVFYHNPCHLKVQNITEGPVTLIKMIPGLEVITVNTNCCGMGGSYGMKKANFELSAKIAQKVWEDVKASGVDTIVTECGGCGLQIEAGTGMHAKHPIVLLHEAYHAFQAKRQPRSAVTNQL
jgi:glycerol-3-phosphate dehydrogenase subunit C